MFNPPPKDTWTTWTVGLGCSSDPHGRMPSGRRLRLLASRVVRRCVTLHLTGAHVFKEWPGYQGAMDIWIQMSSPDLLTLRGRYISWGGPYRAGYIYYSTSETFLERMKSRASFQGRRISRDFRRAFLLPAMVRDWGWVSVGSTVYKRGVGISACSKSFVLKKSKLIKCFFLN